MKTFFLLLFFSFQSVSNSGIQNCIRPKPRWAANNDYYDGCQWGSFPANGLAYGELWKAANLDCKEWVS